MGMRADLGLGSQRHSGFTVILVGPLYEIVAVPDVLCRRGEIVSNQLGLPQKPLWGPLAVGRMGLGQRLRTSAVLFL